MRKIHFAPLLALVYFGAILAAQGAGALVSGAGATFPYPLYSKWFSEYQKLHPDEQINYQSIGSGGGIRQFLEKTIDFGATDSPMTDEQLAKSTVPVLHIPTTLGAVVITYNVPELKGDLKVSGDLVADIFLGKITQWNDSKIAALNPGMSLPALPILVVHRSDGSGTSAIFTDYLGKVSPEWKQKVGAGTAVNWPTGLGGKGNEGVTGIVKSTPGSLGYVELVYAANNGLPHALLRNHAGQFVKASPKSVTAAAVGVKMPADFRVSITDSAGKEAYPISSFTYLLVYQTMPGPKGRTLVSFLNWAMTQGQVLAEPLAYAPLPKTVATAAVDRLKTIRTAE